MKRDVFDASEYDWGKKLREQQREKAERSWAENHYEVHAYLDVNDKHPQLFGDAILLRDDDGMGFALCLDKWRGEHVKITIERVPAHDKCLWLDKKPT